jgi:phage shock protein C
MSIADELDKLNTLQDRGVITPEEFLKLKTRLVHGDSPPGPDAPGALPGWTAPATLTLRRTRDDRWLGGVCGGLSRWMGVDSWLSRLAFALLFLLWGTGFIFYILLWIFVPEE